MKSLVTNHHYLARATTEPPQRFGNDFEGAAAEVPTKGYGAAGFALLQELQKLVPAATGYAVHYPAAMGTENQGAADIVKWLTARSAACPQQKYALGGHSQGGFAVVNAVPQLPPAILTRVVAISMFGSPECKEETADRCISYCADGDIVC
ncbi:carbohydrate esterase family 5 protein [Aulographum hederae CBS 113979]|uniref:Carbohydrate esterase family 5 protein n=1 Tax=Aulographum hederae CBS 113979 TaxID=1176131 RepID=A0A6G1GNT6_9PEZI|nr:carbohydrate esterase family 5 protein [Aulographum hederae CBS 113979]